jgi:hypothetical protein
MAYDTKLAGLALPKGRYFRIWVTGTLALGSRQTWQAMRIDKTSAEEADGVHSTTSAVVESIGYFGRYGMGVCRLKLALTWMWPESAILPTSAPIGPMRCYTAALAPSCETPCRADDCLCTTQDQALPTDHLRWPCSEYHRYGALNSLDPRKGRGRYDDEAHSLTVSSLNCSSLAVVVLRTAIFENRAKKSAARDCQGVQKPSSSVRLSRVAGYTRH